MAQPSLALVSIVEISLYPLLVGSQRGPNKEIPDFGSQREPKFRGSHSFGSRREPKTGDLTSGSQREPREWGWSPFLVLDVIPRRSDPCLCLFTTWAKQRQDNQEHNGTTYTLMWLWERNRNRCRSQCKQKIECNSFFFNLEKKFTNYNLHRYVCICMYLYTHILL